MKKISLNHFVIISLFSIIVLSSCSGGSSSDGGKNSGPSLNAASPDEALKKLSPQHKSYFLAWQNQVFKSCDSSEAFGLSEDKKNESDGIDGAALIKKNKGSVVFSDGKVGIILTGYNTISGTGKTKTEESVNLNGQSYTLSAEAIREGSTCSLYLYGQKVYETEIVQNFNVGSQYSVDTDVTVNSEIPVIKPIGVKGAAEVVQHGIYSLISKTLTPTIIAQNILIQSFGITKEQAEKYFKLNTTSTIKTAVRITNDTSAIWNHNQAGNLISSFSNLTSAFDGTGKVLNLEVRVQIPQFDFKGVKNNADNGNLKLILAPKILKKDTGFLYTLNGLFNQGLVAFNQSEAESCAQDRLQTYLGSSKVSNLITPSRQTVFGPCSLLFPEIENVSYKNGFFKSLIPIVFEGITPAKQVEYSGWDTVLSQLAINTINENKNIVTELDPTIKTKIVSVVSNYLEIIKDEINKSKNVQRSQDIAFQMGLDWSFNGELVSALKISQIIQSVDNSIDVFLASSNRLLNQLAQNPFSVDDQLLFAQSMDTNFKEEALKALNLSKDLNYSLFENEVYNQVIQKKTSIEDLKNWSERFLTIKNEINKYPDLSSVKKELVESSLQWIKNKDISIQELSGLYSALNNSVNPFTESTKQLVKDLGQALQAHKEALNFASNLSNEYKQLALAIRNNSAAVDYENWGTAFFNLVLQNRPSLEQLRLWNDLWSSALLFTQREKLKIAGELGSSSEWNRKHIIEVAVKETWSNQNFLDLESIARVAQAKNVCDRYKDASSLADCAGINLFSKGSRKFFDPAFAGRYANLGNDFNNYMNQMKDFNWTTFKWALIGEFFGTSEPIWSRCDNSLFNQKVSILKNQMTSILSETDQFKKWDLERQIQETIKNCK